MLAIFKALLMAQNSEKGQDLAEYALLIGLIALVVLLAVTLLCTNLSTVFFSLATQVGDWF